jgi:hypothetical protein
MKVSFQVKEILHVMKKKTLSRKSFFPKNFLFRKVKKETTQNTTKTQGKNTQGTLHRYKNILKQYTNNFITGLYNI